MINEGNCALTEPHHLRAAQPFESKTFNRPGYYVFSADIVFAADTALADVALNILCLLMKDQWSWLCTENIQKTIRLLFGTFIER